MARTRTPKTSLFAAVAEALTHVLVSTTATTTWNAMDLLDVARSWPHYVDGKRVPRPGSESWLVEVRSRRRISKAEFREWLREAEERRKARERETARRQRDEARAAAEQVKENRSKLRQAMAAIAAAQAAAPPGPKAAYVYDEPNDRADLVPIVARAGILFVRKQHKRADYVFMHEPTGLGLWPPGREVVKTKARAVELLERAARPEVVAALRGALDGGSQPEQVRAFYAAWDAQPRARDQQRGGSFAAVAAALAGAATPSRHTTASGAA